MFDAENKPKRTSSAFKMKLELLLASGLKITAGHQTMSAQDDYLSGQNLGLAVILTGHVRSFQTIN